METIIGSGKMDFIEDLYHNGIYPSEENTRTVSTEYDDLNGKFFGLNKQLQETKYKLCSINV